MALITDGTISIIEDLIGYESAILETATTEQIDLTIKLGLAQEELAIDLEAYLSGRDSTLGLGNIVVTEALHKWHTFRALALVFRDAYYRQLNDRYQAKWTEYQKLGQWAWDALIEIGVGVAGDPIPRAAKPVLSYAMAAVAAATYFVRVAWRNSDAEEGSPSDIAILSVPEGNLLVVTPVSPPAQARSWNVYVGLSATEQTLQNDAPLAVNEDWRAPVSGIRQGAPLGTGQEPDYFLRPGPKVLWG
ncbi:MAG: hypothetical protein ABSE56_02195 [Bryobacteraceae bacterium]|jgi:hypothetical protein